MITLQYTGKQDQPFHITIGDHKYHVVPGETLRVPDDEGERLLKLAFFEPVKERATRAEPVETEIETTED